MAVQQAAARFNAPFAELTPLQAVRQTLKRALQPPALTPPVWSPARAASAPSPLAPWRLETNSRDPGRGKGRPCVSPRPGLSWRAGAVPRSADRLDPAKRVLEQSPHDGFQSGAELGTGSSDWPWPAAGSQPCPVRTQGRLKRAWVRLITSHPHRPAMAQSGTAKDDIVLGQDPELEQEELLHDATKGEGAPGLMQGLKEAVGGASDSASDAAARAQGAAGDTAQATLDKMREAGEGMREGVEQRKS